MKETNQSAQEIIEEDRKNAEQKYIDELWSDHQYSIEQFDKQLLFISSGALALSLTFFTDVVPLDKAVYIWIYAISLSLFSVCITLCLYSHLVSAKLIKKRIVDIQNKKYAITEDKVIPRLNNSMVITLLLGIFTLVLFTIINLYNMSKKDTGNTNKGGTKENPKISREVKSVPPILKPTNPNQSGNKK